MHAERWQVLDCVSIDLNFEPVFRYLIINKPHASHHGILGQLAFGEIGKGGSNGQQFDL